MVRVVAEAGVEAMTFHAVIAFPDDDDETLEKVLTRTKIGGIISSPMDELLLICSSETDAVFIRCGLSLRTATKKSFIVRTLDQVAVAAWLTQNELASRCEWAALENFEFFHAAAVDSLMEAFRKIVGREPYTPPLKLWPDIFRPNLTTL